MDHSTAPHVLLICVNWHQEGSCEHVLWQQDLETMFIWWALIAHPLSCGLTHDMFCFHPCGCCKIISQAGLKQTAPCFFFSHCAGLKWLIYAAIRNDYISDRHSSCLIISNLLPTDKDECLTASHRCSRHAQCVNTDGSYTCQCLEDYFGNGRTCWPRRAPQSKAVMYFNYKLSKRTKPVQP